MGVAVFWFRRDLRLHDNTALNLALASGKKVLPIFIFDTNILNNLEHDDARVNFIYETLKSLNEELIKHQSSLLVKKGTPIEVWKEIIAEFEVNEVFANKDYEPYAIKRDHEITTFLKQKNSGASAGCTAGTPFPVRVPDLATFLQNKTVCVPPTYVDPMKWQEYHHTDGTLVEYGQGQPKSVGTWSVARNLVTYSYTGDKAYTYRSMTTGMELTAFAA